MGQTLGRCPDTCRVRRYRIPSDGARGLRSLVPTTGRSRQLSGPADRGRDDDQPGPHALAAPRRIPPIRYSQGMSGSAIPPLPSTCALILVDLQNAIDHPSWGVRNNPDAERNIAALLAASRETGRHIFHIRHDSLEPGSHYSPGQPGNQFKPDAAPLPSETVI